MSAAAGPGPSRPEGSAAPPDGGGVELVRAGFDRYHRRFRGLTAGVRDRFLNRDWPGIRRDTVERLEVYDAALEETLGALTEALGPRLEKRDTWRRLKEAWSEEILGRDDSEIAETFFNSLSRRVLPRSGIDPEIEFLADPRPLRSTGWEMAAARTYATDRVSAALVRKVLLDTGLGARFADLEADAAAAAAAISTGITSALGRESIDGLDVLRPVFFRNKAGYLIGRARAGDRVSPVVFALLDGPDGVYVDAVLTTEDDTSILFSFARWYFHVDVESPRQVIGFLHSILPRKRISELYISLGYHKHGKTELYADLVERLAATDEQLVIAPGEPGLVMSVFTLPPYEFVFKVLRDSFPSAKQVTPREVKQRYRLVLRHDRVGRLVDFQEFEDLDFPRARLSGDLLEELTSTCGRRVEIDDGTVIIEHLYVGRRVTPLDLYLASDRAPEDKHAVVLDWGRAIKDLAAADIFPGDLLLKNFGVTRHGRVVFYDYDEIAPVTSCRFRAMPEARHDFEALASEPWFAVRHEDVFPEELERFLELHGPLRETFCAAHGDLFTIDYWEGIQRAHRGGHLVDFCPYPEERRLHTAPGG